MNEPRWRKSSRSGTEQSACVELAGLNEGVGVRDSKAPELGHFTLDSDSFSNLIADIKAGKLDM